MSSQDGNDRPDSVIGSSPPRPSQRERRIPSITPRKFTRFFTPRSNAPSSTSSHRALQDITGNRRPAEGSSPLRHASTNHHSDGTERSVKRIKLIHSSPSKLGGGQENFWEGPERPRSSQLSSQDEELRSSDVGGNEPPSSPAILPQRKPAPRSRSKGISHDLLQLSLGRTSNSSRRHIAYPVADWQNETANFYSSPGDIHECRSIETPTEQCIPFCTATCNTNTLIAVGDEEGHVRLLESAKDGKPGFKDSYLSFRPHNNAIIDMQFSHDDTLLATASGDQKAKVVDMLTQQPISLLNMHTASVKQIRFQPGSANNDVLATSSRDGSVHIWDLRCKGTNGPVLTVLPPVEPAARFDSHLTSHPQTNAVAIHSIYDAHKSLSSAPLLADLNNNWGRIGDVSVTALEFLPEGNEHLIITASEASASVKLWDLRSLPKSRRKQYASTALSQTVLPENHGTWRHFGVSSMALSGDGGRLYTLCKDNTVYTYSTAHLMMGSAPELSKRNFGRFSRQRSETREGLGPLYGFRHHMLLATSFYIKAAIRPAKDGKVEMLAVGSNDGCAILFPTDERYLSYPNPDRAENPQPKALDFTAVPPQSSLSEWSRIAGGEDLPIHTKGTALIRGHEREVGALKWTVDGEVVTVGDDCNVRVWREGPRAKDLRNGGEEEGRRWGCGWADIPVGEADEDDDPDGVC